MAHSILNKIFLYWGILFYGMIERGFLIHSLPVSTEIVRFRALLTEYEGILDKIDRNNGRIANGEKIQLQMLRESMQEMLRNEDLNEGFYFDIEKLKEKMKSIL